MTRGQKKRLLRGATRERVRIEREVARTHYALEGRFLRAKEVAKVFAKADIYSVGEIAAIRSIRYD